MKQETEAAFRWKEKVRACPCSVTAAASGAIVAATVTQLIAAAKDHLVQLSASFIGRSGKQLVLPLQPNKRMLIGIVAFQIQFRCRRRQLQLMQQVAASP